MRNQANPTEKRLCVHTRSSRRCHQNGSRVIRINIEAKDGNCDGLAGTLVGSQSLSQTRSELNLAKNTDAVTQRKPIADRRPAVGFPWPVAKQPPRRCDAFTLGVLLAYALAGLLFLVWYFE